MTARVTVGVPVYNGEAFLEECLTVLRDQTYGDLSVLVFDNASTDRTAEIAQSFASADPRFICHRNVETRPPGDNFRDVVGAATSEYFMWRAHDDLSDLDYVEKLAATLDAAPQAKLAASRVRSLRLTAEGEVAKGREIPFECSAAKGGLQYLSETLDRMHQSWLYGLWRREAAADIWGRIYRDYPHAWASDFLMLFALAARAEIVGTDETVFVQRIVAKASQHGTQRAVTDAATMGARRSDFLALCQREMSDAGFADSEIREAGRMLGRFASDRVYSRMKILRARLGL